MKKLLIIDRDGTIIAEPPTDYQVDSLEKLEFMPYSISALQSISELDYELIMATNQDGLSTVSFPTETFWPAHNKMLTTLKNEGVEFSNILIDKSFESENLPSRKPGTAMFSSYLNGDYDLENSIVIGDRITDIILAHNLNCKGILLQDKQIGEAILSESEYIKDCILISNDWKEIAGFLRTSDRSANVTRVTKETKISATIDLDNRIESHINSGLNFLNHMLDQIVHHAGVALQLDAEGDLHIDEHHTMEDIAIVLGELILKALGSKRGIERYGYALPMDESKALVLVDFGGRIEFVWDVTFSREMVGDVPTEMFEHFFKSLAQSAKCNLHISAQGSNDHHKIEGVFKAFARALKRAIKCDPFSYELPSSKGVL